MLIQDAALLRSVLDAVPSFIFVVDEDVRILLHNSAAGGLLGIGRQDILRRRAGEVLHCIHATDAPGGCGRGEFCKQCIIRMAVRDAFVGKRCVRSRTKMELLSGSAVTELYVLITTTPFTHGGVNMVLLVIEDISQVVELQRIVPICMNCKKVRADDQYWTQVDAYFSRHLDLRFSHGLCPDCEKVEMEKLDKEFGPTPGAF